MTDDAAPSRSAVPGDLAYYRTLQARTTADQLCDVFFLDDPTHPERGLVVYFGQMPHRLAKEPVVVGFPVSALERAYSQYLMIKLQGEDQAAAQMEEYARERQRAAQGDAPIPSRFGKGQRGSGPPTNA